MGVNYILRFLTAPFRSVTSRRNEVQESRCTNPPIEEVFYPEIEGTSSILTEEDFRLLSENVPPMYTGFKWSLLYSTELHGYSLATLYRSLESWSRPVLLVIRDTKGSRFGVFSNVPFKSDGKSSGNYQCFVFRLKNLSLATRPRNESLDQGPSSVMVCTVGEASPHDDHGSDGANAKVSQSSLRPDEERTNSVEKLEIAENEDGSEACLEGAVGGILEGSAGAEGSSFNAEDCSGIASGCEGERVAHAQAASGEATGCLPSPFDILEDRLERISRLQDIELRKREFMACFDLSKDLIWRATDKTGRVLVCGERKILNIGMYDAKTALWMDEGLSRGGSQESRAFGNERLSPEPLEVWGDFSILDVEVWGVKDGLLAQD